MSIKDLGKWCMLAGLLILVSWVTAGAQSVECSNDWALAKYQYSTNWSTIGAWASWHDWAAGARRRYTDFEVGVDLRFAPDSVEVVFFEAPLYMEIDRFVMRQDPTTFCAYEHRFEAWPDYSFTFFAVSEEWTRKYESSRIEAWR